MKRRIRILLPFLMAVLLIGCGKEEYDPTDDLCPGKQPGVAGKPPVMAEGFDNTVDMSFSTVDTNGNPVTNEVFSGTDRGAWLIFWQTDNDKTTAELKKLNDLLPDAKENGYKIVGIVMDGKENPDKAKEIAKDLNFTNIIWNEEVASRFENVSDFFSETWHKENKDELEQFEVVPKAGDPVSTMANSRGQLQSSCYLVPLSTEEITDFLIKIDSNATYEELKNEGRKGE